MVDPSSQFDALHLAFQSSSHLLSDAVAAVVPSDAVDAVAAVGSDVADAAADATDDNGWWQQYLQIVKGILVWVHSNVDPPLRAAGFEQTWGVSIFVFTAMIRLALAPVSVQQTKSSEYMKALKPYQEDIKKKFKDNEDMKNRALSKLLEDTGQNPLSGCFISLVQLPILLALYRSITLLAKEGALDEPFLWIPSLQGPVSPPTYRGLEWLREGWHAVEGASLPEPSLGWSTTIAYLIMPVILVLGQKLTMDTLQGDQDVEKMSDEERETFESSQGILKFLPLLIGFFSLQVPAGLTIYWFTSNLSTFAQSALVKGYYKANPPVIELPDYWDALEDVSNMTPEKKRQAAEAGLNTGPNFEEILDQARFHYVVPRPPIREQSAAWSRVVSSGEDSAAIPEQLAQWAAVDSGTNGAVTTPTQAEAVAEEAKV
eukprot:CAMPEP_0113307238 /NCGR_PEP_ID=MMETSP0010_2-20120614/6164_1 /TAXON_ID=216773 ORGANISM="Corethron hystrix, Strain 308" /NCGR_SAMPLE_ID=MMETSP0010_2 /ASSEMBLY_ACC=CAM_ASM_000155 /LENGTH=429 /DNA_ID=CAMNT_0000162055 /DNA_START=337 /DNA_END=1626 /DNA_ORIENTATION=+ /assembly_acc=CAM_ASM_000155